MYPAEDNINFCDWAASTVFQSPEYSHPWSVTDGSSEGRPRAISTNDKKSQRYSRRLSVLGKNLDSNAAQELLASVYNQDTLEMEEEIRWLFARLKQKEQKISLLERKNLEAIQKEVAHSYSKIVSMSSMGRMLRAFTPGATPLDVSMNSEADSFQEHTPSHFQLNNPDLGMFITEQQHSFDGSFLAESFICNGTEVANLYNSYMDSSSEYCFHNKEQGERIPFVKNLLAGLINSYTQTGNQQILTKIETGTQTNSCKSVSIGIQTEADILNLNDSEDAGTQTPSPNTMSCCSQTQDQEQNWAESAELGSAASNRQFSKLYSRKNTNLRLDKLPTQSDETFEEYHNTSQCSKFSNQNLETEEQQLLVPRSRPPVYHSMMMLTRKQTPTLSIQRTVVQKVVPPGSREESLLRFKVLVRLSTETVNTIWKAANQHSKKHRIDSLNKDLQHIKSKLKEFVQYFNSGYLRIRESCVKDPIFEQKVVEKLKEIVQLSRNLLKDPTAPSCPGNIEDS